MTVHCEFGEQGAMNMIREEKLESGNLFKR